MFGSFTIINIYTKCDTSKEFHNWQVPPNHFSWLSHLFSCLSPFSLLNPFQKMLVSLIIASYGYVVYKSKTLHLYTSPLIGISASDNFMYRFICSCDENKWFEMVLSVGINSSCHAIYLCDKWQTTLVPVTSYHCFLYLPSKYFMLTECLDKYGSV